MGVVMGPTVPGRSRKVASRRAGTAIGQIDRGAAFALYAAGIDEARLGIGLRIGNEDALIHETIAVRLQMHVARQRVAPQHPRRTCIIGCSARLCATVADRQ